MSLVLTGRSEARLDEVAQQIRHAAPQVKVETVVADLSTRSGVSALLDHVGDRPIEVLVNNAGFGSYGLFAEADATRENDEVAVDVNAVVALARAFLPGMLARRSGGILNVASTIAFQPAPYQAVDGASKAFVLSFSEALWAEARAAGVAVTALCPGPTRTGFVDASAPMSATRRLTAGLLSRNQSSRQDCGHSTRAWAVVIHGVRNKVMAVGGRFMPRKWLTLFTARLLRPVSTAARPPIEVRNEIVIPASAERVWDLLADVERWPSWYRACRWVRVESLVERHPRLCGATVVLPVEGTPGRVAEPAWWRPIDRIVSPSMPTPWGCTPSASSRSALPPTACELSSSAMKLRSGCLRDWAGWSWHRGCARPTRRCSKIWREPHSRARRPRRRPAADTSLVRT